MIMNTLIVNIHAHTNICVLQRSLSQCKQETNERGQPQERPQQDCYESNQSRQHGRNQLQDSDEECQQEACDERDHLPQECVGECQQESDILFTISDRDDEPKSVSWKLVFFLLTKR